MLRKASGVVLLLVALILMVVWSSASLNTMAASQRNWDGLCYLPIIVLLGGFGSWLLFAPKRA